MVLNNVDFEERGKTSIFVIPTKEESHNIDKINEQYYV